MTKRKNDNDELPPKKKPRIDDEEDQIMEKPPMLRRKSSYRPDPKEKQCISVLEIPSVSPEEFSVSVRKPKARGYGFWGSTSWYSNFGERHDVEDEEDKEKIIFQKLTGIKAKYYEFMYGKPPLFKKEVSADLQWSVINVGWGGDNLAKKFHPFVANQLKYGSDDMSWRMRQNLEPITGNVDDWLIGEVTMRTDRDLVYDILVDYLEVDKGLARVMVSFLPNDRTTAYQKVKVEPFAKYLKEKKPLIASQIALKARNPKSFNAAFDMRYAKTFKQAVLPECVSTLRCNLMGKLNEGFKLYSYQEQAISWMLQIEQGVKRKDSFLLKSEALQHILPGFYVSINEEYQEKRKTIPKNIPKTNEELRKAEQLFTYEECPLIMSTTPKSYKFGFSGGILADETGVGKTLEALSLIAAQPGKSIMKFDVEMKRFHAGATLVICPNQLVGQWVMEAKKFYSDAMKVVYFTTMSEFNKLTAKHILEADIVLVSSSFLKKHTEQFANKYYAEKYGEPTKAKDAPMGLRRSSRRRTRNQLPAPPSAEGQKVYLAGFHWHRIVLDEGHECLEAFGDDMERIISKYRWYLSASPFPSFTIIARCAHFLNVHSEEVFFDWEHLLPQKTAQYHYSDFKQGTVFGKALDNIFTSHLLYRTTKDKIEDCENFIPDVEEEVVWVDFHPYERALYNVALKAGNRKRAYLYCSMIHDPNNIGHSDGTLKDVFQSQMLDLQSNLDYQKRQLQWAESQCNRSKANHDQFIVNWETFIEAEGTEDQKEKHKIRGWENFPRLFGPLHRKFRQNNDYWDYDCYRRYQKDIPVYKKNIGEYETQLKCLKESDFEKEIKDWDLCRYTESLRLQPGSGMGNGEVIERNWANYFPIGPMSKGERKISIFPLDEIWKFVSDDESSSSEKAERKKKYDFALPKTIMLFPNQVLNIIQQFLEPPKHFHIMQAEIEEEVVLYGEWDLATMFMPRLI